MDKWVRGAQTCGWCSIRQGRETLHFVFSLTQEVLCLVIKWNRWRPNFPLAADLSWTHSGVLMKKSNTSPHQHFTFQNTQAISLNITGWQCVHAVVAASQSFRWPRLFSALLPLSWNWCMDVLVKQNMFICPLNKKRLNVMPVNANRVSNDYSRMQRTDNTNHAIVQVSHLLWWFPKPSSTTSSNVPLVCLYLRTPPVHSTCALHLCTTPSARNTLLPSSRRTWAISKVSEAGEWACRVRYV